MYIFTNQYCKIDNINKTQIIINKKDVNKYKNKNLIINFISQNIRRFFFFYKYNLNIYVGGKDLNFYVGPQAPITNKSTSKEEKTFGNAP